ncbi:MAG: NFYB/HAP3 family transcription factor subunit, partial [Candidatus Aenigmarchaeota archaeon]|nr:NFYB/HAP3 family transcription factor subunit [Candidatus Aenigmarchaeota archaeon]
MPEEQELEADAAGQTSAVEEEKEDAELEQKERLAFPVAAVVRVMRKNLDREKIIKKEVKIAMNKWLEKACTKVAREMNKIPYVTMSLNEFKEGIRVYEDMEGFDKDKQRILAHLAAIKA